MAAPAVSTHPAAGWREAHPTSQPGNHLPARWPHGVLDYDPSLSTRGSVGLPDLCRQAVAELAGPENLERLLRPELTLDPGQELPDVLGSTRCGIVPATTSPAVSRPWVVAHVVG